MTALPPPDIIKPCHRLNPNRGEAHCDPVISPSNTHVPPNDDTNTYECTTKGPSATGAPAPPLVIIGETPSCHPYLSSHPHPQPLQPQVQLHLQQPRAAPTPTPAPTQTSTTSTAATAPAQSPRPHPHLGMFFTDLYRSPKATFSKLRHGPPDTADYGDPDLLSKDKVKQKAAIRKFLAEKIRNDWDFSWPPPPDAGAAAASPPSNTNIVAASTSNSTSTSASTSNLSAAVPLPPPSSPSPPPATSPTTTSIAPEPTSQASENLQQDADTPAAVAVGVDEPDSTHSHCANGTTGLATPAPHRAPAQDLGSDRATHTTSVAAGLAPAPVLVKAQDAIPTTTGPANKGYDNTIDDASDDDASSVYSVFSEDEANFRPRLEWASEISDDDTDDDRRASGPFRFESPDTVGDTIRAKALSKKEKRRRALRDEASWNPGLACFEARRNAWTGAKVVQLRKKPRSPTSTFSPLSPRRLFFRSTPPPTPPLSTSPTGHRNGDSCALSDASDSHRDAAACPPAKDRSKSSSSGSRPAAASYPIETIIPLARPLLPPANPLRVTITPSTYPTLYDRLVRDGMTPGCPINLADMIRACVCGWKRDGEWPPKSSVDPPAAPKRKKKKRASESGNTARRMSFGLLGREKDGSGGGTAGGGAGGGGGGGGGDHGVLRKSVQKIFGLHHGPNGA